MGVKMNLMIITKNHAADQEKKAFHNECYEKIDFKGIWQRNG